MHLLPATLQASWYTGTCMYMHVHQQSLNNPLVSRETETRAVSVVVTVHNTTIYCVTSLWDEV